MWKASVVLQLLMTLTYDQRNKTRSIQKLKDMWGDDSGNMVFPTGAWTRVQIPRTHRKARKLWQLTTTQHQEGEIRTRRASWQFCLNWRVPGSTRGCLGKIRRKAMKADTQRQPLTSASPCTHMYQHTQTSRSTSTRVPPTHTGTCINIHSSYKHIIEDPENMRP